MSIYTRILFSTFLTILTLGFLSSCSQEIDETKDETKLDNKVVMESTSRGVAAKEYLNINVKFNNANQNADDAELVNMLQNELMSAESLNTMQDVEILDSGEPVNDVYVFNLKSEQSKELTFEIYDEEGYDLAGQNKLNTLTGNNYKALNVKDFPEGSYIIRLKDPSGKELNKRFVVAK